MTREEAIYRLKNMAWLYGSAEREQNIEAIDMAIEALSAENSNAKTKNSNQETQMSKAEWIPCSERLQRKERTMRLIDADALIAEIVKTTTFVMDSVLFQKMVDEAPTIDAVPQEDVVEIKNNYIDEISGLLNRIDELTIDKCDIPHSSKPQTDLISRADAIEAVRKLAESEASKMRKLNKGDIMVTDIDFSYLEVIDNILALPSAEALSREEHKETVIEAVDSIDWYHLVDGEMKQGAQNEDEAWYKCMDVYDALKKVGLYND